MSVTKKRQFPYDPDSNLDYAMDWSRWLAPGEVITASVWIVDDAIDSGNEQVVGGTVTVIWLGPGGEPGRRYWITNRIETDQGRKDDRSFVLIGDER